MHHVRDFPVLGQFRHLRIDQDHLALVGPTRHQDARDDRVQAHRLAGAGRSRDEQVRQLRQVLHQRPTLRVFPEQERQLALGELAGGAQVEFLEPDRDPRLVRHLDADGVLARNRCDDADARHLHVQGEIVGQDRDLADAHAGFERDLVLRDDRARVDADHLHAQIEVEKRLLEKRGRVAETLLVLLDAERLRIGQQRDRRQLEVVEALRPPPRPAPESRRDGSAARPLVTGSGVGSDRLRHRDRDVRHARMADRHAFLVALFDPGALLHDRLRPRRHGPAERRADDVAAPPARRPGRTCRSLDDAGSRAPRSVARPVHDAERQRRVQSGSALVRSRSPRRGSRGRRQARPRRLAQAASARSSRLRPRHTAPAPAQPSRRRPQSRQPVAQQERDDEDEPACEEDVNADAEGREEFVGEPGSRYAEAQVLSAAVGDRVRSCRRRGRRRARRSGRSTRSRRFGCSRAAARVAAA